MFCSCCVDYIAAKHIGADAIVHFGSSCLSATYEIPTLYVFPKEYLDVQASCDTIKFLATNVPTTVVVLYDVAYDHCAGNCFIRFYNFACLRFRGFLEKEKLILNLKTRGFESKFSDKVISTVFYVAHRVLSSSFLRVNITKNRSHGF